MYKHGIFIKTAAALSALLILFGCGSDSGSKRRSPVTTDTGFDSRLANASGSAWIDGYPVGYRDGFIFTADGAFYAINDSGSVGSSVWKISHIGFASTSNVTTSGGRLSVEEGWLHYILQYNESAPYSLSSNTLRITRASNDFEEFVRTFDPKLIIDSIFASSSSSSGSVTKSRDRYEMKRMAKNGSVR